MTMQVGEISGGKHVWGISFNVYTHFSIFNIGDLMELTQ